MIADTNIVLAYLAIGLTYFLWGTDKIIELMQKYFKNKKLIHTMKLLLGVFYFLLGIAIMAIPFLK